MAVILDWVANHTAWDNVWIKNKSWYVQDENGNIIGIDNPYEQTKFILAKIEKAMISAGASLKDVVRTRMFVTDISRWEEIGMAHGEYFREIKPVATMVEVKSLISPGMLVEIEVTAILQDT